MQSVYVLVANEDEKVKECIVVSNLEKAQELYQLLRTAYGGANVAMCSRAVDDIPPWIDRVVQLNSMTLAEREIWKALDNRR